jgi:hypothetical protein
LIYSEDGIKMLKTIVTKLESTLSKFHRKIVLDESVKQLSRRFARYLADPRKRNKMAIYYSPRKYE